MSSYRSYAPWKSSLPTSYKSGSTSAYSSRDDISSRYGSLASPSTYRPSFSGGTYRIKRDPVPPTPTVTPYVSRYASVNTAKDPIKSNESSTSKPSHTSKYGGVSSSSTSKDATQIKRYASTNSNLPKYSHSREPSPAALERTNRIKSRESSPLTRTLRGKSRDPSPAIDTKCKLGYGAGNSYRMSSTPRATSTGYSSRYGGTTTASTRATSSSMLDKSISYLSVSDFRARSISRAREISSRKSNEKELEETTPTESDTFESAREGSQIEKAKEESDSESESGEETFISVAVVTRATSPTLPGSTTVQRIRRMDIAKTIEKTINRSTRRKKMVEKEIQSDRMDDPTRYSRFGLSSCVSSYSPHREGRYTSTNSLRYSASPLSTTSKSTSHSSSEVKKEETPKRSPSTESKITKSKLSPPKAVRTNSRQPSVENLAATNANKSLPPTAPPKADSPTKTATSATTVATVKWPNKDFRKSALNVGPTDRPRKSRTPSTGTESDGTTPLRQRQERSPSACSEGSNASAGNNKKGTETKIRQRCHPKTGSTLGRQNSGTSLKTNAHKSCHPAASTLMSSSTSTCSSSGTESANENNKSNKPKKMINKKKPATTIITANDPRSTTPLTEQTGIIKAYSSTSTTIDKNSSDSQPPAVCSNELQTSGTEYNQQIPANTASDQTDRAESSQLKTSPKSSHDTLASIQAKKTTCRLQKLSSVSNFFVARQNDTNSEPIFFESSESSTELDTHLIGVASLTKDFETNTSPAKISIEKTFATATITSSVIEPATPEPSAIPTNTFYAHLENSVERFESRPKSSSSNSSKSKIKSKSQSSSPSTTSDQTASSTNQPTTDLHTETPITTTCNSTSTEQEEPSWWQDTSHQINTSSALDCNPKEEMRYRLRHIDSGEVGWWLQNDEDDTLADDDIKTLNQEEEEDASEVATGRAQSLPITQRCGDSISRDVSSNNANNSKKSWWVSETNDENDNDDDNDNNDNDHNTVADVETQKLESEHDKTVDSECEEWNIGQKREKNRYQTEENQWWHESTKADTNTLEQEIRIKNPAVKQNGSIQLKICRVESGERPWWLGEENQTTVEATIKLPPPKERGNKTEIVNDQQMARSPSNNNDLSGETHWWMSGPTKKLFNVKRVDSGEKAWWQQEDERERESTKSKSSPAPVNQMLVAQTTKLRHSDSGEQAAWWLQDSDTQNTTNHKVSPNGSNVSTPLKFDDYNKHNADEYENEAEHEENGDIEVQQIINYNNNATHHFGTYSNSNSNSHLNDSLNYEYVERPPPLGHRASPDGLEDPMRQRKSPYDNIPMTKVHPHHQTHLDHRHYQQQQQQPDLAHSIEVNNKLVAREKLFISRHKNIDELLGGSCRPLSPLFFEGNSFPTAAAAGRNLFLEEITPDQVRIHDSTPQMPVIQRMERDEWDCTAAAASAARSATTFEQRMLDDAAIQVYKDGDYGAYLDLESSLAEQAEEIEGLNSSRKNSLVVRTQLSVRVHAIIEKLLSAEGSDLRRALFSLKQVFQEDKDLVHAFVALGGLNCLVRVGNGADQNYQNYILRALGQVMLYVDGMNGVMKHEPTMQWLYSLIASKYRSVVKTALKLLLVFVEYVETNCYLLVNAIHVVDKAQGTLPWSNIMRLLKDYDNADAELVIYATSLINKTLAGLTDQDSFYDESDLLEQQGMESVINRYMSKTGTDIDLLDQLQLYEAVLKFEDGEADGLRLPNNSMRKTQRYRQNGNDTVERRKSRRHSTGASPAVSNKVIPSPKRGMPMHGVLDEDSSGSANSNDLSNGGVFQEQKTNHTGTDVTPGLRRRRERAERHKSFLKEQQEAAANGFFANFEKREDMGQLVTAIPAKVKNGGTDSPPTSLLILANEANANNHNSSTNNNTDATSNKTPTTSPSHIVNSNNLLSPTSKSLLHGSNTISIINNSFDKAHTKSHGNKLIATPDFLTKKNLLIERNASTVINGIRKNIQRGNESENTNTLCSNNNNNNISNAYKKYESDANRLNNYYSQLSSPKNNQNIQSAQEALAAVLSPKKTLNGFDFTQVTTTTTTNIPLSPKRNVMSSRQTSKSELATPETPLSSPMLEDDVFEMTPQTWVATNKLDTAAPPPPPPPPPPPDLLGLPYGKYTAQPEVASSPKPLEDVGTLQITESESENGERKMLMQLQRDHTVKDLTQKLINIPTSPTHAAEMLQNRIVGDMSGLISKAKEGLAKSKSKGEISRSSSVDQEIKKLEPKKSENELHWEELVRSMRRPLNLCDLDFTDLNSDDEKDVLAPRGLGGGIPPPPPPIGVPPPMMPTYNACPPPMMNQYMSNTLPAPAYSYRAQGPSSLTNSLNSSINGDIGSAATIKKNKKTVKLFWKEVREDMIPVAVGKTIWDELPASNVDTQKLEHLFESRAKDLITKKQQELNKSKEVIVLDHKRSNAINIAMTKLPPPRAIKAAILKMDATVVTREGIDKLMNMLPTDEERGKIQEAQMANPELPLGSAEQFLLTLASISELAARLKLWAFRLDFDNSEKEIAEPLMDLKQGIDILRKNRTFRCILSTLLSVGIFLNGAPVKGFQIEYLAKVPEVKDTVHKHSLLHHLCHMVMETSSETTDLYSEIGPITRASKADFADLTHNLNQLETECKASWDRLKLIAKHDCPPQLKQKLVDFLADCAERIIILQIVHRRVVNRYRKFLLWLGIPQHSVAESKPNEFCRILSEFALEYRTTRERVQQQIEKKANHRERNKTRGKMIIDIAKFKTKEDRADAELKELLGTPSPGTVDGTLTWRRRRAEQLRSPIARQSEENFTDGDDEILESLVKTATKAPGTRTTPRERKRTRHADRKSLRRTLKNGLTEEEKQHVAALINTY